MLNGHTVVDVECTCLGRTPGTKNLAALKHLGGSCGCLKAEVTAARNRAKGAALLPGRVFGRLIVVADNGSAAVKCRCVCGNLTESPRGSLLKGGTMSCGCLRSELVAAKNATHNKSNTPIYRIWRNITERCTNSSNPMYHNYGGRGIKLDSSWLKFENFYSDMGGPPFAGASIDRIDNEEGYNKDNCRWATRAEQSANTRRNRWYVFYGRPMMLKDIADLTGLNLGMLYYRVNNLKESAEKAVNSKLPQINWAEAVAALPDHKYLKPQT